MEYEQFIIDVPSGAGHQEYCAIFAGSLLRRGPNVHPNESDRRYGISVSADLISNEVLLGKLRGKNNTVHIGSGIKPAVLVRNRAMGLLDALKTATFLERTFHDLHWIGLTPDRVVRYVSKRLLVRAFDYERPGAKGTGLALIGVEMVDDEIKSVLQELNVEWRRRQEEWFGDGSDE